MIDTEHLEMDTVDNQSDTLKRLYDFGNICVLCGKPAMEDAWYCEECFNKWGTEK